MGSRTAGFRTARIAGVACWENASAVKVNTSKSMQRMICGGLEPKARMIRIYITGGGSDQVTAGGVPYVPLRLWLGGFILKPRSAITASRKAKDS